MYEITEADEVATKEKAMDALWSQVAQGETPAVVDMYERAAWRMGATVAETEAVIVWATRCAS